VIATLVLALGGGLGLSGRPIGRWFALGAFAIAALGVLGDVGLAVWSFGFMRNLMSDMSGNEIGAIMGVSMIPTAIWALIRFAIALGGAAALFTPQARAFYAAVGSEGVRGAREA
jgi:hypothetical protein